jgi:hypothetical protein
LLTDAARQAHRSGELAAETGFLERARRMLGSQSAAAAELLPILASALVEAGTFDRVADVAALGASEGARLGLPAVRWRSAVELERTRLYTWPDAPSGSPLATRSPQGRHTLPGLWSMAVPRCSRDCAD